VGELSFFLHMKIAYLILAHKNPQQLSRLINKLESRNTKIFIHIDKKSNIKQFKRIISPYVKIIPQREDGKWGRIGLVKAMISGLKVIAKEKFDYVLLLSGQDYPIKSNEVITQFFEINNGKSFMHYFPIPSKDLPNGGMDRINRYHFNLGKKRKFPRLNHPKTLKGKLLNSLFSIYFKTPRTFPDYLKPYCGSQWSSFHINAVRYVLDFLNEHPDYLKYHKYSHIPDEMFFQSILLNSTLAGDIIATDLRYSDWKKPNMHLPAILKSEDFREILESDQLFARKFDTQIDQKILDIIDSSISKKEQIQIPEK